MVDAEDKLLMKYLGEKYKNIDTDIGFTFAKCEFTQLTGRWSEEHAYDLSYIGNFHVFGFSQL